MLQKIANVLRKIGNSECLKKAEHLENDTSQTINLNLRNLDLKSIDMSAIADILEQEKGHTINSISFSYNNLIGDEGAREIINSLPLSISEIGLVGCGIGDKGGTDILNWINKLPNLKMICIEQNNFSEELKKAYTVFKNNNPKIIVVI